MKSLDVVLLQETPSDVKIEKLWKAEWVGQMIYAHGTTNSKGTSVLIKTVPTQIHKMIKDLLGRYLLIDITINSHRITLVNVYGPNNNNPEFFVDIFNKIDE